MDDPALMCTDGGNGSGDGGGGISGDGGSGGVSGDGGDGICLSAFSCLCVGMLFVGVYEYIQ